MSEFKNRVPQLQQFLKDYYFKNLNNKTLKVLEAGCGWYSPLKLELPDKYVVGIDISEKQLERNKKLNEKIFGGIQKYPLKNGEYDIIVCWDVLEHLPQLALNNFKDAVAPGGIIIIGMPNVFSLKGLVTKYTPHSFHVLFYKYVFHYTTVTGKDDTGPFKTFLKYSVSLPAIKKFAENNDLELIYEDLSNGAADLKTSSKLVYYAFEAVKNTLKVLSFGRLGESELTLVLKKK